MNISLSPLAPENMVSRDGYGRPVPRLPAYSPYSSRIWCLLTGFLPISTGAPLYLLKPPYATGGVPSLSGHAITDRWRSLPRVRRHRVSSLQGSSSNGCCLCITMDQLVFYKLFEHFSLKPIGFSQLYLGAVAPGILGLQSVSSTPQPRFLSTSPNRSPS